MRLSIVIPAYSEATCLGECLRSIENELARGAYDAEVIVVNNASTDATRDVALSYPAIRVVDEPRKGLTFARQAGFEASTGQLIANIDADTQMPPGWIDTVLQQFVSDDSLVALSGPYRYIGISPLLDLLIRYAFYMPGIAIAALNRALFGRGGMLQGGNFVVRRDALENVGGFDTSIAFYGEDTDIALRMSTVGRVVFTFKLPMYTSARRLREEGFLRMAMKYAANYLWTLASGAPLTRSYTDHRDTPIGTRAPERRS